MQNITAQNATEVIGQYMLPDVLPLVLDLEKSKGNYLYCAKDGRMLLDCMSFFASNPVGHNHERMFEPEFQERLLRAARTKPACSDFYTVEQAVFVETFARVAMPKELRYLFMVEGGALGVENALKTAFDWKTRLNISQGKNEKRGGAILHFNCAFHGRSGYTLSLTNTADLRKIKYFPKFDWPRVKNPFMHFPFEGENKEITLKAEKESLKEIKEAFKQNPDDIAAIIIEPIQGEGGDHHFRPEFHQQLRKLADEQEALLIYDEVQTGIGITGKMWAYEHYGMVPDVLVFGKKMQVCGILVGKRVEEVEDHVFVEPSRINSTWGGNLVDMVRCQRYLRIIEEDNLVQNAQTVGEELRKELLALSKQYPEQIKNVRGKGLMCAFDLESGEKRDEFRQELFKKGALILGCGLRSIRTRPSLNFSKKEVSEAVSMFETALKAVYG